MEQRDLIKDQIEQLGRALGKMVTLVLGMDNGGDILGIQKEVAATFDTELKLDFKKLIGLEQKEFQQTIKEKFQNQEAVLEQLSSLLFELGKRCGPEGELRQQYVEKALWTLEYVNSISDTFSMERLGKINIIKQWI